MTDDTSFHQPIDIDSARRHIRAGRVAPDFTFPLDDRSTESLVQEQLSHHEPFARPGFVWALTLALALVAAVYLYR